MIALALVEARLYRPELQASRTDTFEVPPATVRLFRLAAVDDPKPRIPGEPRAVSGHHDVVLKGNGRYWAGASSLNTYGGNAFRKAIPLEP